MKNGSEVYGGRTRVRVVKNKVAPPFREAEFDMIYGQGISKYSEILDLAVKLDIVQKSGAWFYYDNTRLGQGRDNVRKMLEQDPALCDRIEKQVRANAEKLLPSYKPATDVSKSSVSDVIVTAKAVAETAEKKEGRTRTADISTLDIEVD